MLLTLNVLNEDATLNNWQVIGNASIARGSDAKMNLQLMQADRKIRYIPDVAAVITADFLNSDGTTLSKTATFPFADDRSIIQFTFTDAETALLIGQNLVVEVQEGSNTSIAILQMGLQMISAQQAGC